MKIDKYTYSYKGIYREFDIYYTKKEGSFYINLPEDIKEYSHAKIFLENGYYNGKVSATSKAELSHRMFFICKFFYEEISKTFEKVIGYNFMCHKGNNQDYEIPKGMKVSFPSEDIEIEFSYNVFLRQKLDEKTYNYYAIQESLQNNCGTRIPHIGYGNFLIWTEKREKFFEDLENNFKILIEKAIKYLSPEEILQTIENSQKLLEIKKEKE